jgi:hypothetical protein
VGARWQPRTLTVPRQRAFEEAHALGKGCRAFVKFGSCGANSGNLEYDLGIRGVAHVDQSMSE